MDTTLVKSFSDMQGLTISIPSQGKTLGVVEDFYFKPGTNAIDSLRVRTRLDGYKAIPVRAILAILGDTITVESAHMLTAAEPPFPLVSSLRASTVVSDKGEEQGQVSDIIIAISPTSTLRIAGLRVTSEGRTSTINAAAIGHYRDKRIIINR